MVAWLSLDGQVTTVMEVFQQAEQLREIGCAAAERHGFTATACQIPKSITGVDMSDEGSQLLNRFGRREPIDQQFAGVEIDDQQSCGKCRDQSPQICS